MTTVEQVTAAEERMNTAKQELLEYVQRRDKLDGDRYRKLVAKVKRTEAEFIKLRAELS
jgi:capsule polysaccharide export protein KpsE/RkpR